MSRQVTFYTKEGCSLCSTALKIVEAARRRTPFSLELVDITRDPETFEDYKYDIPVVVIDGKQAFRHRVDLDALLQRLGP